MSLADFFMPSSGLPEIKPYERQMWSEAWPVAVPLSPEAIRESAYRLARQELPDAPIEDVLCRAEKIAAYLMGENAGHCVGEPRD